MPATGCDIKQWFTWPSLLMAQVFCGGFLFALILLPGPAAAGSQVEPPRTGLLWHQSGLPATFPLQVRTPAGQDYHLTLIDVETQRPVLAAYIAGGRFFRVLVPPGTFILRFDHGQIWLGHVERFGSGDGTGAFILEPPLTFAIDGINRKAGHLVDLRGAFQPEPVVDVWPDAICQSIDVTLEPSPGTEALATQAPDRDISKDPLTQLRDEVQDNPPRLIRRTKVRTRVCG